MRLQIETAITEIHEIGDENKIESGQIDFQDFYDETLSITISAEKLEMLSVSLHAFEVEQIISFLKTWLKQNPVKD